MVWQAEIKTETTQPGIDLVYLQKGMRWASWSKFMDCAQSVACKAVEILENLLLFFHIPIQQVILNIFSIFQLKEVGTAKTYNIDLAIIYLTIMST